MELIRRFEKQQVNGRLQPPAYVVITNTPWHQDLSSGDTKSFAMAGGFRIPDFHSGGTWTLDEAIHAREKHHEMHHLLASMKEHCEIPSTFDGEIPEFAYASDPERPRLLIGNRYLIKHPNGEDQPAVLDAATVDEPKQQAICAMRFGDDVAIVVTWPLTPDEMSAWRRYPDVFFGTVSSSNLRTQDPLELYDFFLRTYSQSSRENLLKFMAEWPDLEDMQRLEQSALAKEYSKRSTASVVAMHQQSVKAAAA